MRDNIIGRKIGVDIDRSKRTRRGSNRNRNSRVANNRKKKNRGTAIKTRRSEVKGSKKIITGAKRPSEIRRLLLSMILSL